MNWTSYFIHKPVLSLSICLLILFAGGITLLQLPLRLIPKIDLPIINVETDYIGASAETIQNTVTSILQNTFFDLSGVDYIQSSSTFGKSNIQIHFKMGYANQLMLNEVVNKVHSVKQLLPIESDDSIITKISADDKPAFIVAFSSQTFSPITINDYLKRVIKPKLELIPDVASAEVMGESTALRIWLDLQRLEENQLTPLDIANSIKKQNTLAAIGTQKTENTQFSLDASSALTSAEQFNQVVIKSLGDNVLHLNDIGWANLGAGPSGITTIVNGIPASMIFIKLLPEANPLMSAKKLYDTLSKIKNNFPKNMQAILVYDGSRYIHLALVDLADTILITLLIIAFVIFIFLGSVRATLMPILAIPLSLIGSGSILWLSGCSLNTLTLLAMVIAIGLVVDDAIVVVENIYRYRETGLSVYEASLRGIKEIVSPVIGMSIILIAVYLPIIFLKGLTGKIFSEFALTLAACVFISGIVAIVLTPMMCSRLSSTYLNQHSITIFLNKNIQEMKKYYEKLLEYILGNTFFIYALCFLIILTCGILYHLIPSELVPREDQGFLQVIGAAPFATTENYLKKNTQQLNHIYQLNPDIERYVYVNNIPEEHQFLSFITLKAIASRKYSLAQVHRQIQQQLDDLAGIQGTVIEPSSLPISSGMPIQFVLKSDISYEKLFQISDSLKLRGIKSGKFLFIDQDIHFDKPQYNLNINRKLAAELGIDINNITANLALLLGDNKIQQYSMQGENYPVILHVANHDESINQLHLRNKDGIFIPIDSFTHVTPSINADSLNQFQKMNSITLNAVMRPGNSISEGLKSLNHFLGEIPENEKISVDYSGESRAYLNEIRQGWILFFSAVLFIYLLLAVLFESFIHPWIVLISCLPGTFFAVLLSLYLTHTTMNLYTEIAMLTLVGLICKHGILIIQFAEKLRKDCNILPKLAVIQASLLRFRPILMTTSAMLFAAMPLIFSSGVGSVSHFDLGIVLASGIFFGTFFTLIFVPLFYCLHVSEEKISDVIYE